MWQEMREPIIGRFPVAPGPPKDIKAYLQRVEDVYVTDGGEVFQLHKSMY